MSECNKKAPVHIGTGAFLGLILQRGGMHMASYTEHYHLHQWTPEDAFLRTDFNTDLSAIDQALGALAEADRSLGDRIDQCQLVACRYIGTGDHDEANPSQLVFPIKPVLVVIVGHYSTAISIAGSDSLIAMRTGETISNNASWSADGKTLTWYTYKGSDSQMNSGDWIYQVAALGLTE